jgi:hypothetical protein
MSNLNLIDVQLVELFSEGLINYYFVADCAFNQVGLDADNVDAQARRNLGLLLHGGSLRAGRCLPGIQNHRVVLFLEFNNWEPFTVFQSFFVDVLKFAAFLLFAVARLDKVAKLHGIKVQFYADNALRCAVEVLGEADGWSVDAVRALRAVVWSTVPIAAR